MPTLNPLSFRRSIVLRAVDLAIVLGAIIFLRELHPSGMDIRLTRWLVWGLIPVQLLIFEVVQVYQVFHLRGLFEWCRRVVLAWAVVLAVVFGGLFITQSGQQAPRLLIGGWAVGAAVLLVASRFMLYAWMQSRHRRGVSGHQVLIVGDHAYARRLARHLSQQPGLGLRVLGLVSDQPRGNRQGDRFAVLGGMDDLPAIVSQQRVDRIFVAGPITDQELPARVWSMLDRHPVTIQYAPDLSRLQLIGFEAVDYGGQAVFNLSVAPIGPGQAALKWIEDKAVALLALILASPVMLVTALIIKLTSPGPVLFIQERHGLHGRPIRVFKFRSMRAPKDPEAARRATSGLEATNSGRFAQATGSDGRVTWIGRIIRKTSIDELPQLFNVLRGDMSIVGPRPHPIGLNLMYVPQIEGLMRRHLVKPGITGLAQISGSRGETRTVEDMRRRVAYDLHYIRNWSLWLDLKILLLTPVRGILNRQP